MCGIVGYVGYRPALPLLTDGLARLEYRGYDSAGVALLDGGRLLVHRTLGPVQNLLADAGLGATPSAPRVGVGHTRWATHGRPVVANAHPHLDCSGTIAVVHNGIIENHAALRECLLLRGHVFRSDTDTEVVAHLLEEHVKSGFGGAVRKVAELLEGDYALAVVSAAFPHSLAATRRGSPPLLIGIGRGERHLASDVLALAPHTRDVVTLEEGEVVVLKSDGLETLRSRDSRPLASRVVPVAWTPEEAERHGHATFMHKEIHEQPLALRRTLEDRGTPDWSGVQLAGLAMTPRDWRNARRVVLVGCGTSYHASLIGRRFFERFAGLVGDADISSEFRDHDPLLVDAGDVCVFVSQSGETADTLKALRAAKARGARVLAVCNVPGASLTRDADGVLMTAAGPEIGVASTKAFTAQVVALLLMALGAGRARSAVPPAQTREVLKELAQFPATIEQALGREEKIAALAGLFGDSRDFFFLGRGLQYPVALEGALKLKEIAYVRAEAFAAGEMKHGPLALVDGTTVTLALAPGGPTHPKMLTTIEEVKARDGHVIALASEGDDQVGKVADHCILLPRTAAHLAPGVLAVALQLFAYHIAVKRGCDVDRPRNLAKSVTVE